MTVLNLADKQILVYPKKPQLDTNGWGFRLD